MSIYLNIDKNNCTGCRACVNICPHDAIDMAADEYGFSYPVINEVECINCGLCMRICETARKSEYKSFPLKAFAASNNNKKILKSSSSGGVFSALAEYFLSIDGIICGCVFDETLNAIHISTDQKSDVIKIRKSKYLQSNVGLIYRDIKNRLNKGQFVLFTGTPCQIAALYAFLGKKPPHLTTMDLVCHGVPSQKMFNAFINYLEKKHKTKIINFDFRSKKYGWPRYTMEFFTSNQKKINIGKAQEFYLPAFTGGDIIRTSCLSCQFACPERVGDITVGDLWGYQNIDLKFPFTDGLSLFTINTENGLKLLDVLQKSLLYQEIDYACAIKGNMCLRTPPPSGKNREFYLQALLNDQIEIIARKYKEENKNSIIKERIKLLIPKKLFIFLKSINK